MRRTLPHTRTRVLLVSLVVLAALAAVTSLLVPGWGPIVGITLALGLLGCTLAFFIFERKQADDRHRDQTRQITQEAHARLREERRREVVLLDKIDQRSRAMADRVEDISEKLSSTETDLQISREQLALTRAELEETQESLEEQTGQMANLTESLLRYEAELARARIFADEADVVKLADHRRNGEHEELAKEA